MTEEEMYFTAVRASKLHRMKSITSDALRDFEVDLLFEELLKYDVATRANWLRIIVCHIGGTFDPNLVTNYNEVTVNLQEYMDDPAEEKHWYNASDALFNKLIETYGDYR